MRVEFIRRGRAVLVIAGLCLGLSAVAETSDCVATHPNALEFCVVAPSSIEGAHCEFRIANYLANWGSLTMKDYFRETGGWTPLGDGRIKGDIRLECIKACELQVLSLSAGFLIQPVVGRAWQADGVSCVLPEKPRQDIFFGSGTARSFLFPLPNGKTLRAEFDRPVAYSAQDGRLWGPRWSIRLGGSQSLRAYKPGDIQEFKVILSAADGLRLTKPQPWSVVEGERWAKLNFRKTPEKGSALDWSEMGLQDAPAGKYGWLKNVNGHFEFEGRPGVEQRFYGVNLCSDANYPDRDVAEMLVERLVRCGYNSVRVHHHDDRWTKDDASRDRLDYLIALCLKRGLYITTDLYVSRQTRYRDIGIDKDGPVGNIDEYRQAVPKYELAFKDWCAFAEKFLKHRNPYTGRTYLDEPGMPLISLINEGGEHKVVWDRCSAFVRSLGSKALLTNDNNGSRHGEGEGLTPLYDYVDNHFYVDHPHFLVDSWQLPSHCPNVNPVLNGGPSIFLHGWAKGSSKPYTITEWNFSGPGRYRAVGGILTGAIAAEQEWDGLWRFAYSHSDEYLHEFKYCTPGYFDCVSDPLGAASDRASVCLFLRGDATPGSLTMDTAAGEMRLVSPRTCGCFTEGGALKAGALSVDVSGAPATVWVSSLDQKPVAASSRLLLVHLTDAQGNGNRYADPMRRTLLWWGSGCLVEVGAAKVALQLDAPGDCVVHELDTAGKRVGTIPAVVRDGSLAFEVSTRGPNGGRLYYEIARRK